MTNAKYPIGKRFVLNGVEFYIEPNCGMGRSGNYAVYCITDQKSMCSRARFETCVRIIEERANRKERL